MSSTVDDHDPRGGVLVGPCPILRSSAPLAAGAPSPTSRAPPPSRVSARPDPSAVASHRARVRAPPARPSVLCRAPGGRLPSPRRARRGCAVAGSLRARRRRRRRRRSASPASVRLSSSRAAALPCGAAFARSSLIRPPCSRSSSSVPSRWPRPRRLRGVAPCPSVRASWRGPSRRPALLLALGSPFVAVTSRRGARLLRRPVAGRGRVAAAPPSVPACVLGRLTLGCSADGRRRSRAAAGGAAAVGVARARPPRLTVRGRSYDPLTRRLRRRVAESPTRLAADTTRRARLSLVVSRLSRVCVREFVASAASRCRRRGHVHRHRGGCGILVRGVDARDRPRRARRSR